MSKLAARFTIRANLIKSLEYEVTRLPKRSRCPYCDRLFNRSELDEHVSRCRLKQSKQPKRTRITRRQVVVDGNNVAYYLTPDGRPRITGIILAVNSLRNVGLRPIVVVSSALKYNIDNPEKLEELVNSKLVIEAPRGSDDDLHIIKLAEKTNSDIVTNDRFLEWQDRFPWLDSRIRRYRMTPAGLILIE
jgi:hypothetical protein